MQHEKIGVGIRMTRGSYENLKKLCTVNDRGQRAIIEILINKAFEEYRADKRARVDP